MEYNKIFYGEAYCVKCKDKVTFEGDIKVSDSGRRMAQGKCPQCGTRVNRILGATPNAPKPELAIPQPAVVPKPLPYAKITISKDGKHWCAWAYDSRRGSINSKHFRSRNKNFAIKEATEWVESYKVIEFFRGTING